MADLPLAILTVSGAFAPLVARRLLMHVKRWLVGAIRAPGKRTVTAVLRAGILSGLTWCALALAPQAQAATFAELPFAGQPGVATCLRATGEPGEPGARTSAPRRTCASRCRAGQRLHQPGRPARARATAPACDVLARAGRKGHRRDASAGASLPGPGTARLALSPRSSPRLPGRA